MPIYTIGHSNHTPDGLLGLLGQFGITNLIDIRSVPYSGRFPYFNRKVLKSLCEERNIVYEWRGDTLGGLRDGKPSFDEISSTEDFSSALNKLIADFLIDENPVTTCLICAERDPARCHRSALIGPALHKLDIDLHHILADGTLILQSELSEQLKAPGSDRSGTLSLFDEEHEKNG